MRPAVARATNRPTVQRHRRPSGTQRATAPPLQTDPCQARIRGSDLPSVRPVDLSAPGGECCAHAYPHRSRATRRHHRLARRAFPLPPPARLLAGTPRRSTAPTCRWPIRPEHFAAAVRGLHACRVRRRQRHHPAQARRLRRCATGWTPARGAPARSTRWCSARAGSPAATPTAGASSPICAPTASIRPPVRH